MGGAEDVDAIDLERIDDANSPGDIVIRGELAVNFFATFRLELLGIVQPFVAEFFRKNDRGGDDGTGERAATGLIDPGNSGEADGAQSAFMAKPAAAHRTFSARLA